MAVPCRGPHFKNVWPNENKLLICCLRFIVTEIFSGGRGIVLLRLDIHHRSSHLRCLLHMVLSWITATRLQPFAHCPPRRDIISRITL